MEHIADPCGPHACDERWYQTSSAQDSEPAAAAARKPAFASIPDGSVENTPFAIVKSNHSWRIPFFLLNHVTGW